MPNSQQANGTFLDEIKKITASDGANDDRFGTSLDVSGDTLVAGSPFDCPESSYVFSKDSGGKNNWGEVKKLVPTISIPCNTLFGYSVNISGDLAIVGAYRDDSPGVDSGSAYIFAKDQGGINNWGEVKKITASDASNNDQFGLSVAISNNIAVVGSRLDDDNGNNSGSAYIFAKDQGGTDNWGFVKKITASDGVELDQFGIGVSIFENDITVGTRPDLWARNVAYVFAKDQGGINNWGEVKILTWSGSDSGTSVLRTAINDNFVLLGDPDGGVKQSYLFEKNLGGTDNWGQRKTFSPTGSISFGRSVSIFNDLVAVGSSGSNLSFVFSKDEGGLNNWGEIKQLTPSESGGAFGDSMGISEDVIAVGDPFADGTGSNKGAVYLFDASICTPSQSGDWIITENCTLLEDAIILGNVLVQNNSLVTIPSGVTLNIDFANFNLTVKSGSGVLIKSGGTVT